ncbi:MAG: hypothetical protein LBJ72_05295 [Dysgonamonadaceae bacterium]|jgi:hypothetical protein|nr:hypothetical protein [Dysgonamonadaceae bacterium]
MKIDLFLTTCFSHETDNFSIDDEQPAMVVPFKEGIADVENTNNWNIYFVPLDKNFICYKPDGKDEESLCDVLLICVRPQERYDFYFVELKSKQKSRSEKGIEQLKTTIDIFKDDYPSLLSCLAKKRAFLVNQQHPFFQYNQTEKYEKFHKETRFRLIICATIPIK